MGLTGISGSPKRDPPPLGVDSKTILFGTPSSFFLEMPNRGDIDIVTDIDI